MIAQAINVISLAVKHLNPSQIPVVAVDQPLFALATVLDFELLCLQLVRAIREADFSLYLKAIRELLPWMFALDSHNYARWLSVHYRDMCELPLKHPDVYA